MNKDFYNRLPGFVCACLDTLIEKYNAEFWFETAWEEYRQHVLNTDDLFEIRMPGFIFKKYTEVK